MTLSIADIALYVLALFILFVTPGPVWLAIIARTLSGGFKSAWPLALGVAFGDIVWALIAILGVSWIIGMFDQFMVILRYFTIAFFLFIGINLIKNARLGIAHNPALTKPGNWAGFAAGIAVILSNPKAVLFYIGILPTLFDLTRLTLTDIVVLSGFSAITPLIGNLLLALFVNQMRRFLTSPKAIRNTNLMSGISLIIVAMLIAVL